MTEPNRAPSLRTDFTIERFNTIGKGLLPEYLGVEILEVTDGQVRSRLTVRPHHLAPNGFLHAATVIALADTTCGYGTVAHLPQGAQSFTTIELKTNFLGTAREGGVLCVATAEHLGRTTQIWDAVVTDESNGRKMALFRCSQMVLWPR